MATRTLVAWCLDWPVAAAGFPPEIPVAVLTANRVIACSAAARAEGIRRGLRRREAQARCPSVLVLEHDDGRDARAFEPVVAAVEAFTPGVEIVRPGMCAVSTRGPSRYFGGDGVLAAQVVSAVTEVIGNIGTACQVGIADGPFAAELAARQSLIVPPGESPAFLAPFAVGALDRPELTDVLVRLGIRTLGQFAALPSPEVLDRFGPDGALAHRLAQGLDERPLETRVPPPDLAVSVELDPPALVVETAAFAARGLATELHDRLAKQGLACTLLSIEAETEHGERMERLWRYEGGLSPAAIAERVRWQLDGWLRGEDGERPTAGITLVRLAPDEVAPDDGRQLGFWGGSAEADERAERALVRVQGLLGVEAVQVPVLQGGRSPAERVRWVNWGDARTPSPDLSCPWPGHVPSPAPSVVYPEPLVAEVVDEGGSAVRVTGRGLSSATPCKLSISGGRWQAVTGWAGPWPADERWWDATNHRRRARFQLVTGDNDAHLLSLEGGRWWVEATYE